MLESPITASASSYSVIIIFALVVLPVTILMVLGTLITVMNTLLKTIRILSTQMIATKSPIPPAGGQMMRYSQDMEKSAKAAVPKVSSPASSPLIPPSDPEFGTGGVTIKQTSP